MYEWYTESFLRDASYGMIMSDLLRAGTRACQNPPSEALCNQHWPPQCAFSHLLFGLKFSLEVIQLSLHSIGARANFFQLLQALAQGVHPLDSLPILAVVCGHAKIQHGDVFAAEDKVSAE